MRLHQRLLGIVGLLAIGGTSACGAVSSAKAANSVQAMGVSVEVSPNRVSPGSRIAVRANCSDKSPSATVTSPAFGTITVAQSNASSALLVAETTVPNTVQPGTFDVTVTCGGGGTATTKLTVVMNASAQPTVGPHTGGGFLGGREDDGNPALPWLVASAATLAIAGMLTAVSIRRRRRTLAIPAGLVGTLSVDATPQGATPVPADGASDDSTSVDWATFDRASVGSASVDGTTFDRSPVRGAHDAFVGRGENH